MSEFSKRALNKAKTKLALFDAVTELTKSKSFKSLHVEELVQFTGLSRKTFFNYFGAKEDLLLYSMRVWVADRAFEQYIDPLQGKEGIKRVFEKTAEQIHSNPHMMNHLIAYIVQLDERPKSIEIEPAEIYLRYPGHEAFHRQVIPSGEDLLLTFIGSLSHTSDKTRLLYRLTSIFYGDAFVAHITGQNIFQLYKESLNSLFKELE